MQRPNTVVCLLGALLFAAAGAGCGSDHGFGGATFSGNVTSVSGSTSVRAPSRWRPHDAKRTWFAGDAMAVSCAASHVLACVDTSKQAEICGQVDPVACTFAIFVAVGSSNSNVKVHFVDDSNRNGAPNGSEASAPLTNDLGTVCDGTVVTIKDVSIDFTAPSATAASIEKSPETCGVTPTPGTTPSPSPSGSATPGTTATVTGTPSGTPTHTPSPSASPSPTPT